MKRSKEELDRSGIVADEYAKEIARLPPPDLSSSDINIERKKRADHLASLRHLYPIPGPISEVNEEYSTIKVRDGYAVPVKIYTPVKPPSEGSPLIVMMHEGGWMVGDFTDEDLNCRMFARDLGAVCVNVDYRLAPEYRFPTGWNDCWDVIKYLAANASTYGADPTLGFLVGGSSAGGNLSAVMAHLSRDKNLQPPITGHYLGVPALLPPDVVPEQYKDEYLSRESNIHDPIIKLPPESWKALQKATGADSKSALFAPFNHPDGHANICPAYLQVGGIDPLRDEGLLYERVLREEHGVETRLDLYAGFGHMFWTCYPEMETSKRFVKDTLEGFKWLLEVGRRYAKRG